MITTERFMGYDKDENGNLVINPKEATIVRRIFELYLEGKGIMIILKMGLSTIMVGGPFFNDKMDKCSILITYVVFQI